MRGAENAKAPAVILLTEVYLKDHDIVHVVSLLKNIALPARLALRSQEIAFLLSRYGIAGALGAVGIEFGKRGLIQTKVTGLKTTPLDQVFGKNLALTCVKLGPTFIKLGQMLSTRPDLVGESVSEELKVLFDRVPPVSFSQIKKTLKKELGKEKWKNSFESIDSKPLGSASLGQTHKAVLKDSTPVILKVQKEGVDSLVQLDLLLLSGLAHSLNLVYPRLGILQMFRDFETATKREIDYLEEAKNIDQFKKNYRTLFLQGEILFPDYHAELTTRKVIALEPIRGKKVQDLKKGTDAAKKAASLSLAAVLEQIFDHGFFHADPHGGNLFFMEDSGQVAFIDLGMVGQLNPSDKTKFVKVVSAILKRDRKTLAKALYDLGEHSKKADFAAFEKEVQKIIDDVKQKGMQQIRLDKTVNQLLAAGRKNGIYVPNRYILMIRSCLMIEGVAKALDPNLSLVSVALPIVAKSLLKSYNPFRKVKR